MERPVVLYRARTPGERQHVVLAVQKHWERVGQRPRAHLLVWDTEDGLAPIDAQLEDTAEAFEALPWFHKAAIGDGAPYSYHSAVRDLGDLELDEIGGVVIEDSSDAVWIVELLGVDHSCGLATMRALYDLAFVGRAEMRTIVLHAVGGVKNFNVMQFYTRAGFVHPQAVGKRNKDFAVLAAGGLDVFSAADMQRLTNVANSAAGGDRPMFFNSLSYNAMMELSGSTVRTGTAMTTALCAERGDLAPTPVTDAPMTEQEIADNAYLRRLADMTTEELDFVRQQAAWPPIRTSRNPMAEPGSTVRKKNDWHEQRTRFVVGTFAVLVKLWTPQFCPAMADGVNKDALMDALFDGGAYGWLKSTACVIMAVQQRYGMDNGTRTKVFTALMHLCEIKQYMEAKNEYIKWFRLSQAQEDIDLYGTLTTALGAMTVALVSAHVDASSDEEAPPSISNQSATNTLMEEIFGSDDETDTPASDQNATDTLMQELFGSDDESEDNAHPQSTATERDNITKRPRSETPVSSPPPREPVEMPIDADAAAHAKHQEILTAIERLRADAAQAMTDGDFSPPVVTEGPSKEQKQSFLKMQKFAKTVRDYMLLGTQYGDVQGDHEPVRRDWFRAVFVSAENSVITDANRLWSTPDTSKKALRANADWQKAHAGTYVEISDTAVRVHYIDRLKPTKGDVPESHAGANAIDITEHAPQLAQMLRNWQSHAASAQPGVDHPLVIFQMECKTWGQGFDAKAYGKAMKRAWGPLVNKYGAPAPVKPEKKGAWGETGCTGARHITKQARRGVKNEDQDKENSDAAARQMHTVATDRNY